MTLDWSPVARARNIDLGFEHETDAEVMGNRELLAELCGNLIDNAVRYAGDGSTNQGLPLEVFLFVNETSGESYEQIQSDIFDYVYGILPLFHLRVWQMR